MFSRTRRWLLASSVVFLAACGGGDDGVPSVLGVAKSDSQFSILVEAVQAAGLDSTLNGAGSFTVFAPTNAAFGSLLTELGITKAELLGNKALLTTVLTYHVVPAKVEKAAVPVGKAISTVQGGFFKIDAGANGSLVIQDGRNRKGTIVATDLAANNGVVHAIDKVILPADRNIVQTAQALPDFSILAEAVAAADLAGALSGTGPFTVFAPTNAAFAELLAQLGMTKAELLGNKPLLTSVLKYHVVSGRVLKADITVGAPIVTLELGKIFTVDGSLTVTDSRGTKSKILTPDVFASNGVIHVIDRVILP